MKVWVLEYREYDDVETLGVYSTLKRAKDMVPVFLKLDKHRRSRKHFDIESFRVDRPDFVPEYRERLSGLVKLPRWAK